MEPGRLSPDELIADMLAKDPHDRPQTMAAVQRVLRFAVEDGTHDGPTVPQDPPARVLPLPARPSSRALAAASSDSGKPR